MISGLFSLLGAAVLVVIDQLIKHWATAALLPVGNMDLLPGIVELRYCLNDGMAFSMLAGKQTLLIGMTSVMLVVVAVMLFARKMPVWERISWTLILGGGVGNLIDRVLNGGVVDSINVLIIQAFSALAAGGTIICTQYLGQKNHEMANRMNSTLM